jgi:hypothetical protein
MSNKICIYCGAKALTKDHVPPKSFFTKPALSNLVTVPSCFDCNNSFSKNEEYARTIFASAWQEDGSTKLAEDIWHDKVVRSLSRNHKLLKEVYESFREVDVYHNRIYLGKKSAIAFDRTVIELVIDKIIKGLFYHKRGKSLNKDFKVKILYNPKSDKIPKIIADQLKATEIEEIGEGVIRFRAFITTTMLLLFV